MREIPVNVVYAFVDEGRGGNPAGVVLDGDRLTQAQKQKIAARAGLSETAFVSASKVADFKLEFFTPTRQIPHCGHATIATFSYLAQLGKIKGSNSSKETVDGVRQIFIEGDEVFMEQKAPQYQTLKEVRPSVSLDALLNSLRISRGDLLERQEPLVVNTGNSFLVIPMKDEATLAGVKPDFQTINTISEKLDLIGYYLFSPETRRKNHQAGARMFAPRYGIPEESATGMAAGPLACYLFDKLGIKQTEILIEQGHFMDPPSPSLLTTRLNLKNGEIQGLMVGGRAMVSKTLLVETD